MQSEAVNNVYLKVATLRDNGVGYNLEHPTIWSSALTLCWLGKCGITYMHDIHIYMALIFHKEQVQIYSNVGPP